MMTDDRSVVPSPRPDAEDLHFDAPWEATAFAMTVMLSEAGAFTWGDWVEVFSRHVAEHEGADYYRVWLYALEALLAHRGMLLCDELASRHRHLIDNPPPHDHVARREPITTA